MRVSANWIIDRRSDLTWYIGSAVASYIVFGLALLMPAREPTDMAVFAPAVILFLAWGIVFDGSHVFATYTRTYFDREFRSQQRPLLYGSLGWLLLGPAVALVDMARGHDNAPSGPPHNGLAYTLFLVFAFSWAYYHLLKQHYGFLALYKRKNADLAPLDDTLDKGILWAGFTYPYLRFLFGPNIFASGLMGRLTQDTVEGALGVALADVAFVLDVGFAACVLVYLGRTIQRMLAGEALNLPKYLLLVATIPMHVLVLRYVSDLLLVVAALTIMHNLQYHRIIWMHNQNAYQSGTPDVARHGAAVALSRTVGLYLAAAIAFAIPYRIFRLYGPELVDTLVLQQIVGGATWGIAFHHYYLDAKIWKLRKDPKVRERLALEGSGEAGADLPVVQERR